MMANEEATQELIICRCCGNPVGVADPDGSTAELVCPKCGMAVGSGHGDSLHSDTETINLNDMAHMAQEGVDASDSGEWDTSGHSQRVEKGRRKV